MDLFVEAKKIFEESIKCGNCSYYKEKSGLCKRLKEVAGVEIWLDKDSTCFCGKEVKLKERN